MCGIAGLLTLGHSIHNKDIEEVQGMTALLKHRGPDCSGIFKDKSCVLGNARLKIIDLSDNASLPMSNENQSIWISYNGEVTNFRELRQQFQLDKKHIFRSTSDTEVVIHLYEELGIDFLSHLSGMFAFCLYDTNIGKAYIVRDFYGIRPLFYMIKNSKLYFASEIKAFLDLSCFNNKINYEAIYHFLSLAYIPGTMTPFEDIQELDGSHLIEVDLKKGTFTERKYYTIDYSPDYSLCERDVAHKLHDILLDSVRRNLISDAPLGLTLSGGFDTSTILALVKELGLSKDIHTYSIKMGETSFDESYYQRIMVDFAKPIHHEIVVNAQDVMDNLIRHMAYMDEPSGDGAAVPSFLLAQEAKKEVSVLLSGEGGDEVFNAYETHRAYKVRELYLKHTTPFLRKIMRSIVHGMPTSYKKLSLDFLAKRFTSGVEKNTPEAHFFWRHVLSEKEKKELMPRCSDFKRTDSLFTELFNSLNFDDNLNKLALIDLKYYFIGDLMVKNDRTMMAHSIEARFPYVDRYVVEYASTIPPNMKVKGTKGRYIQKQAMKDYLPKAIYNRQNMGLEMPHAIWFMNEFQPLAKKYFTKKSIEKTNILSYSMVNNLWQEHIAKKRDNGRSLWCILNFLIWFDLFIYNKDYKKYLL
ncbi:MAG: asparagine synthase (glutamine-hydrolyzing) [Candidatus Omnitrophica bacterium]|nr:asparagine synthase (glutamine-hydrolyzing) [Candidatus Omnitrophota bacterium]